MADPPRDPAQVVDRGSIVLLLIVLLQLLIPVKGYFGIDSWFGFGALFGFLSCVLMVIVAKLLGAILKRPDDYYDV
ncbi:hypothetical protein G3T16_00300 [Kineobactrum salinum]|uniref:Uncharacterized protein n=1 Tax=Kineobactrum salinum TaxID=2708301 RepID=A0A6C0U6G6_9GAMM|nr:hypothetical protein G3T16_00300 [Kineobactrum salinum]